MMKTIKKLFVIILTVTVMAVGALVFSSCGTKPEPTGEIDITSNWSFYSVTGDDGTVYRETYDREENLPFFVCDGTAFEISTVPGTVRRGTVTENEDGTFTLTMDENGREFQAVIEGNMLVIYFGQGRELAFEAS